MRRRGALATAIAGVVMLLLLAFALMPIVWVAFTSFKTRIELFGAPGRLLPKVWTIEACHGVLANSAFPTYFANSVIVNVLASIITVPLATLAGYSFLRFRILGKSEIKLGIMAMQMFPSTVLLIAVYVVFRQFGMLNTYTALVLSYITHGLPFSIWMMRGFVDAVPVDVEEAAMINGSRRGSALVRVVVPMMLPGMIAVALFALLSRKNDLVWATTFTTSSAMRLIPPGFVLTYVGQFQTYWNELMAGSVMVCLPTILVFVFLQRYRVQGLTVGTVKG